MSDGRTLDAIVRDERETSVARGARLRQLEQAQQAYFEALARGDAVRADTARAALVKLQEGDG